MAGLSNALASRLLALSLAIFITGAASGMGLETARLFAAGGWLGRRLGFLARLPIPGPHRLWLRHRGMPDLPADSFRAQWRRRHG